MGFKTFNAGEVLTASDVNTYLMKQAVIVCTSGTRPSSPSEGWTIYETDTDTLFIYSGSTWVPAAGIGGWTTFGSAAWSTTGSAPSIGNGSLAANYQQHGKTVRYFIRLVWGSTTTGGTGDWRFNAPFDFSNDNGYLGAVIFDTSATNYYPASCYGNSTTPHIEAIGVHTSAGTLGRVTASHPMTWANGDLITISGVYQST